MEKEIESFISSMENEINKFLFDIAYFSSKNVDVPIFVVKTEISFERLKFLHFEINKIIFIVKESSLKTTFLSRLLHLKFKIDLLVKSNNKYSTNKKSFENNYKKQMSFFINKNRLIPNEIYRNKKLVFIKSLFELLVKEKRIQNNKEQKKSFHYLFFPFRKPNPINWENSIYDLKSFFDLLYELEMIKSNQKYFNDFIKTNFKIKNKQGKHQTFRIGSYKSSGDKIGYQSSRVFWEKELLNIQSKFG